MLIFFGTRRSAEEHFKVFQSQAEKYRILFSDLKKRLQNSQEIALIYFFEDTGYELQKLSEAAELKYIFNDRTLDTAILVNIWDHEGFMKEGAKKSDTIILCPEFHPMRSVNQSLLSSLPSEIDVEFYTELDNAFFKGIGLDKIGAMASRLGLAENELIQHSMIDASIVKSQKKLEKSVSNPKSAKSLEEWVDLNLS